MWTIIRDESGTRRVWREPRRKRKYTRARFSGLKAEAILIKRNRTEYELTRGGESAAANQNSVTVKAEWRTLAIVTDRWFDPVRGQDNPLAGEMAAVQRIDPGGPTGSKYPHTLRGPASQGYDYATPEEREAIQEYLARQEALLSDYRAGRLTIKEARLKFRTVSQLMTDLGYPTTGLRT